MAHQFDATLKDIVHDHPNDYGMQFASAEFTSLRPLNVDLSTVTAATDIVLAQGDPIERILDLNFQANAAEDLARRVLLYNALLHYRYSVPVQSVVVLLRPAADHPTMTGRVAYQTHRRFGRVDYRFRVVRLWKIAVTKMLSGPLGTLPLAVLGKLPKSKDNVQALQPVLEIIAERIKSETKQSRAERLISGTVVLCGLRLSQEEIYELAERVPIMKESTTYDAFMEMGKWEGLRRSLVLIGSDVLGKPNKKIQEIINEIQNTQQLERLIKRVHRVSSWQELLNLHDE